MGPVEDAGGPMSERPDALCHCCKKMTPGRKWFLGICYSGICRGAGEPNRAVIKCPACMRGQKSCGQASASIETREEPSSADPTNPLPGDWEAHKRGIP